MIILPKNNGALVKHEDKEIFIFKSEIADCFEKYGGSFVQALGVALFRADTTNTYILLNAFKHYVEEYVEQFILPSKNFNS